ncbi:MAG: hypothetical protein M1823_002496 [Watsoniomyces obsoletus]|nr:MAG: hypothetical protein M1823_002496 [Watsoniomyces obsoletus]
MHLTLLTALVSLWISLASASFWGMMFPRFDLEYLREMVRRREYKAFDPDTLPFKDDDPDPKERRRKECAKCMWQILMLQIEELWPPGTRLFQEEVRRHMPDKGGKWVERKLITWATETAYSRSIQESNTINLASYCSSLMGVRPWDKQRCRPEDWDQSLQKNYDPFIKVLVGFERRWDAPYVSRPYLGRDKGSGGQMNQFQGLRVSKEQLARAAESGKQMWMSAKEEAPKMVQGIQRAAVAGMSQSPSRVKVPFKKGPVR